MIAFHKSYQKDTDLRYPRRHNGSMRVGLVPKLSTIVAIQKTILIESHGTLEIAGDKPILLQKSNRTRGVSTICTATWVNGVMTGLAITRLGRQRGGKDQIKGLYASFDQERGERLSKPVTSDVPVGLALSQTSSASG